MLDNDSWWCVNLVLEAQCTVGWQGSRGSTGSEPAASGPVLRRETRWEQKTARPYEKTLKESWQMVSLDSFFFFV